MPSILAEELRGAAPLALRAVARQFLAEGFLHVRNVVTRNVAEALRGEVDRVYREIPEDHPEQGYPKVRAKMFHYSQLVRDHVDHVPIIDLVETILGDDCHLVANNAFWSDKSYALNGWHCDGLLMSIPPGVELDDRIVFPCHSMNVNYFLTDVGPDDGPTEVVPTSQRSGRWPPVGPPEEGESTPPFGTPAPAGISFRGHEKIAISVEMGDVVMLHTQIWHRGAAVRSDKTRYVLQFAYGQRNISQRLYPFVNYQLPEAVLVDASPRRRRILGLHERGQWG